MYMCFSMKMFAIQYLLCDKCTCMISYFNIYKYEVFFSRLNIDIYLFHCVAL